MNAPFYKFGAFGDPMSLIVAFLLGLGFGFFLERAGFGSARKLAAQFYFRDLAVLKVMFTAIITAMVGLFLLSAGGLVDLSQVSLKPTVLGANILGGLVLGLGFVIGGYCPGTSVVSSATGKVDGWVYVGGLFFGMFTFGELIGAFPGITAFIDGSESPRLTLAQVTGIPYGALVLAVVVMAVVAFMLAEWAEVKVGGADLASQPLIGSPPGRWNSSRRLLALLLAGAFVAALAGNPYRGPDLTLREQDLAVMVQRQEDRVTVDKLADWMISGRDDYRLVDLRSAEEYAAGTLPGAENIPLADLPGRSFSPTEKIVLFTEGETPAAQAWIFLEARGMTAVYVLQGGLEAWKTQVLHPVVSSPPSAQDARRVTRARAFGGTPMTGPRGETAVPMELPADAPSLSVPPPALPSGPSAPAGKKKKRKEGC